jgi:hypothetical protein
MACQGVILELGIDEIAESDGFFGGEGVVRAHVAINRDAVMGRHVVDVNAVFGRSHHFFVGGLSVQYGSGVSHRSYLVLVVVVGLGLKKLYRSVCVSINTEKYQ